jgi:hypothetical protein
MFKDLLLAKPDRSISPHGAVQDLSAHLRRVADNISIHPLLATEVFLGPIKEGTVGHSVRPHVAVKDPSVLLHRVEDNVSAHPLLAVEVFLGPIKEETVVVVLGSEVPAFR